MIALLAVLWLGATAEAAPTPELRALAEAPGDAALQLAVAQQQLRTVGREELGIEVLLRLLDSPSVAASARGSLVGFLGQLDANPGWGPAYERLLRNPTFVGRELIALRSAELRLAVPAQAKAARAELDALSKKGDAGLSRAVGRALLRSGDAAGAVSAFQGAPNDPAARDGLVLSLLAMGSVDRAKAALAGGAAPPGAIEAVESGSALARAEALTANGYPNAAIIVLAKEPVETAGPVLARIYRSQGRLVEASLVLAKALELRPGSDAIREMLIDVYLDRARYAEAQALMPRGPRADELAPLIAWRKAWESRTRADDAEALAAAWSAKPDDPFVARSWATEQIRQKRAADTLSALSGVLRENPTDGDALGLHDMAAIAAGSTGLAVERQLAAAARESSASVRATRLAKAAELLTIHAEELKRASRLEDALEPYLLRYLMAEANADDLMGLGGLLWELQRTEAALTMYRGALKLRPKSEEALVASCRLLSMLGREEEGLALIDASNSSSARVRLLRVTVENTILARGARAAMLAGDTEAASVLWRGLVQSWPAQAEFHHGLGDALAALEQHDEAVAAYRQAFALDPKDAWAVLGEANSLAALGRDEDARLRLDTAFPRGVVASADRELPRTYARAWRITAAGLQAKGKRLDAFAAWREAFERDPEVWSLNGLAGLYLDNDQPEVALAFADEGLALDPKHGPLLVGRVLALEALGRWDEARTSAAELAGPDQPPEMAEKRRALVQRLTVSEAENVRRNGRAAEARAQLEAAIAAEGGSGGLYAALASAALDQRDCPAALDYAPKAMEADPTSRWGYGVAVRAASVCRVASEVLPRMQEISRLGPPGVADAELRALRLELAVQRAEKLAEAGRIREAAGPLREAEGMSNVTADEWTRIGGGWLAAGETVEAAEAFEAARARDPNHVAAIVGLAGCRRAEFRLAEAESLLSETWEASQDPRLGLQLVQVKLQRGKYTEAEALLVDVKQANLPALPEPASGPHLDPLPILALPSGRKPGPRTYPPSPARDVQPRWLVDARESIDIEMQRERSVYATAGGGVWVKPGVAGEQRLDGWYIPLDIVFPTVSQLRFDADVAVISLDDGVHQALGVAPSVGVATAPSRPFWATARVGTSPIGFEQLNVLWHGHARIGVAPSLALGLQTARTPISDSMLSWAGYRDDSGVFFGFVSQLWASAYLSFSPEKGPDLGVQARGGYTEGFGIEPNPFVEGVAWASGEWGKERLGGRVGVLAVGAHHVRQEDGFVPGQGGYFSPPLFVLGGVDASAVARFSGNRGKVCANAFVGLQVIDGEPTPWFGTGLSSTGRGGLGAAWRIAPQWSVGVDGRAQVTPDWYQAAGIGHLTFGLAPTGLSAPSLATMASAGAILPSTDELCRVD